MDNKIEQLTQKLLTEGVEKGKAEAEKIIASANDKAAQIIAEAQAKAEEIEAAAKKNAAGVEANTKNEIRMFAAQALNALKVEIANVVCDRTVKAAVEEAVGNKDFMNEFMLKMAEKWGAGEDMVISAADATVEQVNGQKAVFTVEPKDGSYKVNFGEAEFEEYFKGFLRPQLVEMIF